jgi:hypothetical protein
VSGYQNGGLCSLPEMGFTDPESPMDDFIDEMSAFPKGANDDWVDCFVHGMTYYTRPVEGVEQEDYVVSGEEISIDSLLSTRGTCDG